MYVFVEFSPVSLIWQRCRRFLFLSGYAFSLIAAISNIPMFHLADWLLASSWADFIIAIKPLKTVDVRLLNNIIIIKCHLIHATLLWFLLLPPHDGAWLIETILMTMCGKPWIQNLYCSPYISVIKKVTRISRTWFGIYYLSGPQNFFRCSIVISTLKIRKKSILSIWYRPLVGEHCRVCSCWPPPKSGPDQQ